MKKIILILFVLININNSLWAADADYNCKLNTQYKVGTDGEWENKFVNFSIYISKDENLKIYDHEINLYYDDMPIIKNDNKFIFAVFVEKTDLSLDSVSINKKTGYTQFSFLGGISGGTTLHFGYCK